MKIKMDDYSDDENQQFKVIDSGVNIKWEHRKGKMLNEVYLHLKHVSDTNFLNELNASASFLTEGLYFLDENFEPSVQQIYPVIDQIHDHILSQYESGGCKYLESEKFVNNN